MVKSPRLAFFTLFVVGNIPGLLLAGQFCLLFGYLVVWVINYLLGGRNGRKAER